MHQQIKASPDSTPENMRKVVDALAAAKINIEAIAPDFESPHVRVLVKHNDPFDPDDKTDTFNQALEALRRIGFKPTIVRAVEEVSMTNAPGELKIAMDTLEEQGETIDSILVLPGGGAGEAFVSFGVLGEVDDAWEDRATELQRLVQEAIDSTR
jgi:hypothetical protein